MDRDACKHIGPQHLVLVVESDTDGERAGFRVEFGIDVVDRAVPHLPGQVVELHHRHLAGLDPGCLALEDFGQHPDLVEFGDGHDFVRRRDEDAFADAEMGDDAVGLGIDADALPDRTFFLQPRDLAFRDAKGGQPLARGLSQHRVVAAQGSQELLLRIDERRRVEFEQQLSVLDRVAGRLCCKPLDPTVDARVHVVQRILVELHVADGVDAPRERAAFRRRHTNAEIVYDRRIDLDGPGLAVDLVGIYRHEVHAHR